MKALAYFTEKNHMKDTKILVAFSTFDNIDAIREHGASIPSYIRLVDKDQYVLWIYGLSRQQQQNPRKDWLYIHILNHWVKVNVI